MALTIPWPTRAITVSSPAPPMSWRMLVRTVTRARTLSTMPSLDWPSMVCRPEPAPGTSMTLGFTEVATASSTSRPARSMAAALDQSSGISGAAAAIMARTTLGTRPPAR